MFEEECHKAWFLYCIGEASLYMGEEGVHPPPRAGSEGVEPLFLFYPYTLMGWQHTFIHEVAHWPSRPNELSYYNILTQSFDHTTVRKMAPGRFNKFVFSPSEGASGGIFVGWNGSQFLGQVLYSSKFAITIQFSSTHNAEEWNLTTVYGPCQGQERSDFIEWLNYLVIDDEVNWILMGDFNFYRLL
jgi:hypothetical protein